jgi:hypothetical protein
MHSASYLPSNISLRKPKGYKLKGTEGQNMIYKTLHRKEKIEQRESH